MNIGTGGYPLRKTACAVILTPEGKLYLFQKPDRPFWEFAKGGIEDSDKNPYAAVLREVREETGILPENLQPLQLQERQFSPKKQFWISRNPSQEPFERDGHWYGGNEYYWFAFQYTGNGSDITLNENTEHEQIFERHQTINLTPDMQGTLASWLARPWRDKVYEIVKGFFSSALVAA